MKKCFYFPTLEEQKDVMISLDARTIDIPFAKNGFNLTKNQEFIGSHMEVELSHSLDYNRVYRGNLQLIKGSSVKSKSEQEFTKHQNKYPKFKDNFDKLYSDCKIEFREEYRTDWIRFTESTPSDPILAKLCESTGAKMYGDYIVLDCLNHISDNFGFYTIKNGKLDCIINIPNIFKQYSLFLQGKENKWEEAKNVLGI